MLRVVYSNRLEALSDALCEALPAAVDPFATTTVVVPGRLVARWVQYAIAARRGIAAQLEMPFLEAFLARAYAGDRAAAAAGLRALDRRGLAALIGSALADGDLLAEPAMAHAADYLADDDDGARQVRRVQLADRVATLCWDYALTRPEWLDAWEAGRDRDPALPESIGPSAASAWQARLWRALCERMEALPERWTPVPRLPRARRRLGLAAPALDGAVHVIGFSYLARSYLDALEELAAGGDVTIHMLNPCAEFWEDVPDRARGRTRAPRRRESPVPGDDALDPPALRLWGRPARDTVAALVDRTAGDFDARFADPGGETALAAMLRDALARAPADGGAAEAGVTVLACPSLTRELEIVGSEIGRLLAADPSLRASDVAVLVAGADADRYLAQLPAVFASLGDLPFHIIDLPLAEHGRVAEGALLLLELPLGRFTRPELLGLMTHPAVLARHPHVDPDDWVRWAERLGIVHGAGAGDHAGTYLEGVDLFHWDQGVRRLALGAFMAGARSGASIVAPGVADGDDAPCLPEEIAPDRQASAATFALLARSLIADATWVRAQVRPLAGWAEILELLAASYLGARDEHAERELARVRASLAALADLDLDGRPLGYREVVELVRHRLGQMRGDRGEPLAHGVLVSPLQPMRPLPFRVVFGVGLGEGKFPAGDAPSPLDLRTDVRRGDVPLRDRDRYAFFETLLAARDRIYLSYIARDAKSGEALGPSSVVIELADMLAPYLGHPTGAAALGALTVVHPLRRWDDRYQAEPRLTPSAAPALARERWAAQVRRDLVAHLTRAGRAIPPPGELRALLERSDQDALRAALGLGLCDGAPAIAASAEPIPVALTTLRRFLESPVQAWAEAVLGLDTLDDEDPVRREDEPFGTDRAERAALLRDAFGAHVGAGGEPARALDDAYRAVSERRRLAGQAPVGVFGDAERKRDLDILRGWSDAVGAARGWQRVAFGRARAAGARLLDPIVIEIELDGAPRRIELTGQTELLCDDHGSVILIPGEIDLRHHLRGAFDHLALAAAGLVQGHRHRVLSPADDKAMEHAAWSAAEARGYLAALCEDLLGRRHDYLLSSDMAKQALADKLPKIERPRDGRPGSLGYGPLRRADGLALPPDWRAIVARRWRPLAEHLPEIAGNGNGNGNGRSAAARRKS